MKVNKLFFVALAVLALMLSSLACEASASTANISNAHMSVDETDLCRPLPILPMPLPSLATLT